ncbi:MULTISPECIES: flavin-containing monooxygenase [unclassified Streptomyces]|uniref:flavin-containing monooxygenase n=1 Tax=unclassified Streptomyces TaxID=2593676 RepID=UPI001660092D|nr:MULTISPECIES: NAD(P)-binding domain-containing protein [unclassified Streptomyces]MBD0710795.1 monooxygenase [Streptomyces sp. CBMA291]MBD0718148.1 monooxygenase [Streptomyces sp. CBMA370]
MGSTGVAVIGAGAAGLATAKALLDEGLDVTVLERGTRPGGLWAGDDTAGDSPAYGSLHLNTSKGRTQFADLPMPAEWPDFPSAALIARYLARYADDFGITGRIRFATTVTAVRRAGTGGSGTDSDSDADTGSEPDTGTGTGTGSGTDAGSGSGWEVESVTGATTVTERYAAVVVANGHNRDPKWPSPAYPGTFDGTQMHAHDYRSPEPFAGRRVLVVGMGNSAMDIAVDASYVSTGPVLLSARHGTHIVPKYLFGRPSDATGGALAVLPWRLRQRVAETVLRLAVGTPERYGLPRPAGGLFQNHPTISDTVLHRLTHGEIAARPGIARLDGRRVHFTDGTAEDVDVLVWATGYHVTLPFLDRAWTGDDPEAMPLYQRVFHLDDPTLAFVGLMQSTGAALPVVEAQAKLVAAHLSGRYALPAPAEQRTAVRRAHAAAVRRWGTKRPMMRVDFDQYVSALPREIRAGVRRAARGATVPVPKAKARA